MKKNQVVKFWTAISKSTNNKEIISSFSNKPGYAGQRTLVRYIQVLDGIEQGLTSEAIAKKSGWSLSLVNKLRGWWETDFVSTKTPESDPEPTGWVDYSDVWPSRYAPPQILPIIPIEVKPKNK
jgi:hypothetical protein